MKKKSTIVDEILHFEEHIDYLIFRRAALISLFSGGVMWFVKVLEWITNSDFGTLGIYPRTLRGSIGILTSPLIHADFMHLISNFVPLFTLMVFLFYFYRRIAWEVFVWIYLTIGIWVWAFAREAYHIGSSGLVYGLASFLLTSGLISRNVRLIAASLIVVFLHGGIFSDILPSEVESNISWESHLTGFLAGIAFAVFFRKHYKYTRPKEEDDDNDPEIHDGLSNTSDKAIEFHYVYKQERNKGK